MAHLSRLVSLVAGPAPDAKTLVTVQWLRFLAAAAVVISHLNDRLVGFGERYGFGTRFIDVTGEFGVCIFFIISGFIMIHVAGPASEGSAAHEASSSSA